MNAAALAEEPRWGRLYVVTGNVSVRESPADGALKVRVLKAGQTVRVDFQDEAWAAVFDPCL
ncbi:MAG TPA: LPS ABC transporter substrate-binding protein LptA, partial [Humidesulfovibrio sp.]|nr:LPS ABC transporter substrate-binding protein LptA [Humidesulfovibrio sp.]